MRRGDFILFEDMQFTPSSPDTAAYQAGYFAGQALVCLLILVLAVKCLTIARRPQANAKCALALMIVLLGFFVGAVAGIAARQWPSLVPIAGLAALLGV